ncbi:MAG TPA: hypothetical protein VGQ27_14900 [Steroidobacteraceae bacterium]|nr:hypothetical protein [Steroidobacteraceae bacterium]
MALVQAAPSRLLVHEWGTFTSFQDERGQTIAGINVDDEPVPFFVHRLGNVPIFTTVDLPAHWSQGAPRCHPDVTLRLETPVMYFYPPAGWDSKPFDVRATFVGGWLTEFYPSATADGLDFPKTIDATAKSSLSWEGVRLDPQATHLMPETDEGVWLAPRKVASSVVREATGNEAEKYIFYRGVGHLDAPIVVREQDGNVEVSLRPGEKQLAKLPRLWLVDVAANGNVRYQAIEPQGRSAHAKAFPIAAANAPNALPALEAELARTLQAQGLFADEAAAMLETWSLSYFESEGLRVFFVLPQSWTDQRLPLSISVPADVTRVMVGRVELVTPHQREVLQKIYALSDDAFPKPLYTVDWKNVAPLMSTNTHAGLYRATGREVPESLQLYNSLGRFRDALLAHEYHSGDIAQRMRLDKVMRYFSACAADLPRPMVTKTSLPTAQPGT